MQILEVDSRSCRRVCFCHSQNERLFTIIYTHLITAENSIW